MACPHCQAEVASDSLYCSACGMAVRVAHPEPRVVNELKGMATSFAGQSIQGDMLVKKMKTAFRTLLVLGLLMTLSGGLLIVAAILGSPQNQGFLLVGVPLLILGIGYLGLAIWSRRQPFEAALTGLIIYVALNLLGIAMNPLSIADAILIKIIVIVTLVNAVRAGLAHRRVAREMRVSKAAVGAAT